MWSFPDRCPALSSTTSTAAKTRCKRARFCPGATTAWKLRAHEFPKELQNISDLQALRDWISSGGKVER